MMAGGRPVALVHVQRMALCQSASQASAPVRSSEVGVVMEVGSGENGTRLAPPGILGRCSSGPLGRYLSPPSGPRQWVPVGSSSGYPPVAPVDGRR